MNLLLSGVAIAALRRGLKPHSRSTASSVPLSKQEVINNLSASPLFRFPESSSLNSDGGVDYAGQCESMHEFINQNASPLTNKRVSPLLKDELDSPSWVHLLDLLHLHLLGDRDEDSVL